MASTPLTSPAAETSTGSRRRQSPRQQRHWQPAGRQRVLVGMAQLVSRSNTHTGVTLVSRGNSQSGVALTVSLGNTHMSGQVELNTHIRYDPSTIHWLS